MVVELLEAHWRLTPDQKVQWTDATQGLDYTVAAEAVTTLASASRETPSIALFHATYESIVKRKQRVEKPSTRAEWFEQQKRTLEEGRAKLAATRPERLRLYGIRQESRQAS